MAIPGPEECSSWKSSTAGSEATGLESFGRQAAGLEPAGE